MSSSSIGKQRDGLLPMQPLAGWQDQIFVSNVVDLTMNLLAAVAATAITGLLVAGPLSRLRLRGGFGAYAAYEHARKDLDQNGRTSIRASFMARLFQMGPLELDGHGFTLNRLMSTHAYAWLDISKPLAVEAIGKRNQAIAFYILKKNKNFGKRRLFVNGKDEFVQVHRQLPPFYSMGQDNLVDLMNRLWNQALVAGKDKPTP